MRQHSPISILVNIRDAVVIDHLDKSLTDALSQLIDLLAITRTARAALEEAR